MRKWLRLGVPWLSGAASHALAGMVGALLVLALGLALLVTMGGGLITGKSQTPLAAISAPASSIPASPTPTSAATATRALVHPPTSTQGNGGGVPGSGNSVNPWGYNFTPGVLIYSPPADFCNYFVCIPSFWTDTNGYVVECQDTLFSHSGGVSGACSSHGGEWRPLYAHPSGSAAPTPTNTPPPPTVTFPCASGQSTGQPNQYTINVCVSVAPYYGSLSVTIKYCGEPSIATWDVSTEPNGYWTIGGLTVTTTCSLPFEVSVDVNAKVVGGYAAQGAIIFDITH